MAEPQVIIRRATSNDLPILGSYGATLARQHHAYDPQRFMLFEPVEAQYAWFYGEQLSREGAAVLVAESEGEVLGYAFVSLQPKSSLELLAAAWIHDVKESWAPPRRSHAQDESIAAQR